MFDAEDFPVFGSVGSVSTLSEYGTTQAVPELGPLGFYTGPWKDSSQLELNLEASSID